MLIGHLLIWVVVISWIMLGGTLLRTLIEIVVSFVWRRSLPRFIYYYHALLLALLLSSLPSVLVYVLSSINMENEAGFTYGFLFPFVMVLYPITVFVANHFLYHHLENKYEPTPYMQTQLDLAQREMRQGHYSQARHYLRLVDHPLARELENWINRSEPDEPDFLHELR